MTDQPQVELSQNQVPVPHEFLAEHGRVSLENASLRRALGEAHAVINELLAKLQAGTAEPEPEQVEGIPIIRRRPEVVPEPEAVGATPDAS